MHMGWNWPYAKFQVVDPDKFVQRPLVLPNWFKRRYRPLRQWRWSRLIFWFVTVPLSILIFAWELKLL